MMKRVGYALVVLLMLVGAAGWFFAGHAREWLRTYMESQLGQMLGATCRIATIHGSVWPLHAAIDGVRCGEPIPFFGVNRLRLNLGLRASLTEMRPVLSIGVERPYLDLSERPPPSAEAEPEASGPTILPRVHIARLEVQDVSLRFDYDPKSTAAVTVDSLHAKAQSGSRGVTAHIGLVGAVFEHKGHVLRVHELQALAGWTPKRGLYASRASLHGEGVSATLSADEMEGAARVQAQFSPEVLGAFVEDLIHLNGNASADAVLHGDLTNPEVVAGVHCSSAALAGRPIGDLTTRFVRHGADLSFEDIYVVGPAGEARGQVMLRVRDEVPIWGEINASGVVLREVLQRTGAEVEFGTLLSGRVTLEGQIDPLELRIRGRGEAIASKQLGDPAGWDAEVDIGPKTVRVLASATQLPGNHAQVQLNLDGDHFEGQASLEAADIRALQAVVPTVATRLAMTGRGATTITFAGTPEHPRVSARIAGEHLTVMGSPVPQLVGDLEIAGGLLDIRRLRMETRTGALIVEGRIALAEDASNDLTAIFDRVDGDVLLPLVGAVVGFPMPLNGGVVNGTVTAKGPWHEVVADLRLGAERVRLVHEPLSRLDLKAFLRGRRWQADLDVAHAPQQTLTIRAQGVSGGQIDVSVDSSPVAMGELVGAGRHDIDGTVVVRGRLTGEAPTLSGSIVVRLEQLRLRDLRMGVIEVRLDATPSQWTVRVEDDEKHLLARGLIVPSITFPYELSAEIRDLDLSGLTAKASGVRLFLGGSLSMRGTLAPFSLDAGTVEISHLELSRDAYVVRASAPLRFRAAKGIVLVEQLQLEGGNTRLEVAGKLGLDGRIDLGAKGGGDLVLLELFGPPFEATRGPFAIEASVRNDDAGNWRLAGAAQVDGAVVDLGLPIVLTHTAARIRLDGARVIVDRLTGRAGGGHFEVQGSLDLIEGGDLSWRLQDVGASTADGLEARLTGKGTLTGPWEDLLVRGHVEVVNALYDRDLGLADLLQWLTKQLLPKVEAVRVGDTPVRLDLVIYSRGGVYLDNNIVKGEMWLDLHLTGNAAQPQLAGRIGILDAEVAYEGRTFTVTGGSIDFRDSQRINPTLNIGAESRVSTPDTDYLVSVIVTGTAERPRVQFSADDPAMSQNDVLSLVAFGKTGAQMERDSTSVSPTATALALLPTGAVERRVGAFLGVDRFEVSATQARDTGAIEPRVTVGKNLTDQLSASVWTSFGVQARQALQLEYRWTRRVSLLGSWESQVQSSAGAFGGAVKFRFEYWRMPFSLMGSRVPLAVNALPAQAGDDVP